MKRTFLTIAIIVVMTLPAIAHGQNFLSQVDTVGTEVYGTAEGMDLLTTIGVVIRILLSTLGIVFLLLVVYAGFMWMTAGGNKDRLQKAQKMIMNAAIGLVITIAAYAIADFVVSSIQAAQ
ncbi:MAG: hypothetical protein ABH846_01325 [Patescibacteria group bacterium]